MVQTIEKNNLYVPSGAGAHMEALKQGQFAFIAESIMFDKMEPEERCHFYAVGGLLLPVFHGIGLRKGNNTLRDTLNKAILDNFSDGTVKTLKEKWIPGDDAAACNQVHCKII